MRGACDIVTLQSASSCLAIGDTSLITVMNSAMVFCRASDKTRSTEASVLSSLTTVVQTGNMCSHCKKKRVPGFQSIMFQTLRTVCSYSISYMNTVESLSCFWMLAKIRCYLVEEVKILWQGRSWRKESLIVKRMTCTTLHTDFT